MRKKPIPLETHLKIADDLAVASVHLDKAYKKLTDHYSKTHPVMKQFYRILPWWMDGAWSKLKSRLDNDYHRLITDDEFKTHGHIYYNLEDRYNKSLSKTTNPEQAQQKHYKGIYNAI